MKHLSLSTLLLALCASSAAAQEDALLPTHLIDGGSVFVTGTLQYATGRGEATFFGAATGDIDQSALQFQLNAGVGLGQGFEIGATIYYQAQGKTSADFSTPDAEFITESEGFSDLLLEGRYRILQDGPKTPQLIVGAVVVAPVGNDKDGRPELKAGGVTTQEGEDSGIGQGVWHYGFEAGLSKHLGFVEPYLLTSYIFGDKRTENGVQEDRADAWNLLLGAQWTLTPQATLDTSVALRRAGVDEQEDNGLQTQEESHLTYTGQVSLYVHLGNGLTFLMGGGVSFIEDHELNDVAQLELKDDYIWFVGVGLHVLIGAK